MNLETFKLEVQSPALTPASAFSFQGLGNKSSDLKKASQKPSELSSDSELYEVDYTSQLQRLTFQEIQRLKKNTQNCRTFGLWDQEHFLKQAWDLLSLFFIVYQAIVVPYRIFFFSQNQKTWNIFEIV